MFKKKKKKIVIGEFETDNANDYGIAKYYEQKCKWYEEQNLQQFRKIHELEEELKWYKNHQKIEIINLGDKER